MEGYKYTSLDIEKAAKASKIALCVFLFIAFLVVVPGILMDESLSLKEKFIGCFINVSVLTVCLFAGEAFRRYYIKKKAKKLLD